MSDKKFERYHGLEENLQKTISHYLNTLGVLWYHPPNEIKAKPAYLKKRALLGVKSGVPDLCIMEPRGKYHGFFMELKVGYKKPKPNQIKWLKALNKKGYYTCWTNSLDEAIKIIDDYLDIKD